MGLFGLGVAVLLLTFAALTIVAATTGHPVDAAFFAGLGAAVVAAAFGSRRLLSNRS